ncbi:pyrroline-5-carboxylate reductase [Oceanirhabdus sp. W0125-5]|uniref:pyrroline-5-carboxylate reductase n=1 Tax=Oceanirhabdus sp. W0125-5 TaxID=2999116 RepID=UPI0022F2BB0E|nr:pyrroline-5-carboxylate reductase [Oceanirhabdus sp. W0125-5]WBW95176.1 pyrroline-5-carboxylate reductase [Oceanirhabdus sp. W0125-5]
MGKVLGFIGCGNMARAMIGGIVNGKAFLPENIIASDLTQKNLDAASKEYGILGTTDNNEVAQKADILVLSIKPDLYSVVIDGIKDKVKEDAIIVTIAAGKNIRGTEKLFGKKVKVVRVMPNTPALVGEGMAGMCANDEVTNEELEQVQKIFNCFGKAEVVSEKLMDVVTAVSGSAPAYVYMFIEAMADAAVLDGMPRDKAYTFAAQTVLGSAKMVIDTGMHPGVLKDMVCSPGGTTIEAVAVFEKEGLRNAVISAMRKCRKKSNELSNY